MQIVELEMKKVKPDPNNPRLTVEEIKELSESIKKHGQTDPIHVQEDGKGYLIEDGHRRYAAMTMLKSKKIQAIVNQKTGKDDLVLKQAYLDAQKKNLSVEDRDKAWKRIWKTGKYDEKEFRKILGTTRAKVVDFFDRMNLDPDLKKLLKARPGQAKSYTGMLQESRSLDKKKRKKVLKMAIENDLGHKKVRQIREVVKDASDTLVDEYTTGNIDLEDVKKLKNLSEAKQKSGISAIKSMKGKIREIPKVLKDEEYAVEKKEGSRMNAHQFSEKLKEEIESTTAQLEAISGVLYTINESELYKEFTPGIKKGLKSCLDELEEQSKGVFTEMHKALKAWEDKKSG